MFKNSHLDNLDINDEHTGVMTCNNCNLYHKIKYHEGVDINWVKAMNIFFPKNVEITAWCDDGNSNKWNGLSAGHPANRISLNQLGSFISQCNGGK